MTYVNRSQTLLSRAVLAVARRFAIGGSLWDAVAPSGNGMTAAMTTSDAGDVRLWVRTIRPTRMEQALAGADAPRTQWIGIGEPGAAASPATLRADALAPDMRLTSQADATLKFVIRAVDRYDGYVRVVLEQAQ